MLLRHSLDARHRFSLSPVLSARCGGSHRAGGSAARPGLLDSRTGLAVRTSKHLLSDIRSHTGVSLDKSPGDSLLFEHSALRGISYALTTLLGFSKSESSDGAALRTTSVFVL